MNAKFLVGIVLLVVGLGGGLLAAALNVRTARGPKERAFVFRACTLVTLVIFGTLALIYCLPSPTRYVLLVPYLVVIPFFIYRAATKRQLIRRLEQIEAAGESGSSAETH